MRLAGRRMSTGPVYDLINSALRETLKPSFLLLENESHRHKSRGEPESHFKGGAAGCRVRCSHPLPQWWSSARVLREKASWNDIGW
jgi:hypothetical protein